MPRPDVEAVIPQPPRTGVGAKVVVIRKCARRLVFVVTGRGARAGLVPPPGRLVAVAEVLARAVEVRVVAEREHRAADRVEKARGGFRVVVALRDIARADEHLGHAWR